MFEWDEEKAKSNLARHGVAFHSIRDFDLATAYTVQDTRKDYGEDRFVSYGWIGDRLHILVWTLRENIRVISLRKANQREVADYEQKNASSNSA